MAYTSRKKRRKKSTFNAQTYRQSLNAITPWEAVCAVLAGVGVGVIAILSAVLFFSSSLLRLAMAVVIFGLRANRLLITSLRKWLPLWRVSRYVRTQILNEELWRYLLDSRIHWKHRDGYRNWRIWFNTLSFILNAAFAVILIDLQSSSRRSL